MQNDMKSTIQAAVAEAVEKTMGRQLELLARQLELLGKIAQFLGIESGPAHAASAPKRAPVPPPTSKRPPAPATGHAPKRPASVPVRKWVKQEAAPKPTRTKAAPQKRRGRPPAAARTATAAAPSSSAATSVAYAEGQEVRYKQGRGSFSAKVTAVDKEARTVTLARVSDGRKVVRPFDKVMPA
ncbi:PspA [Myxococcus llanfairpwllgwyngyllgogerychwyrndrobwllllantysiliogogogochensis]|uniref:PspA n=1 Tax=Myxococcus llanfairpwllgwyngyllgogerychwyrndrobwllllantysiliogogogochensis TaxID=2590453 RepID=A0A540WNZ8_9BACT|nr:PspA [Myxococcus llanfairpwllgwyngyllgogerychwyrndrobwllllantysiliogogogochensis]TQF10738.1 PspA [Myxococcus llanfairpwllgwyngyllgogerychwyrndrobwllllantysiliogogogochensis]